MHRALVASFFLVLACSTVNGSDPPSRQTPQDADVHARQDEGVDSTSPTSDANSGIPAAPQPATAMVGPNGGELRTSGMTLKIPSGALSAMSELKVSESERSADELVADPVSNIYEFGPAGLKFSKPVTIRMELTRDPRDGEGPPSIYWTNEDSGEYEMIPTRREGRTLLADISHFSSGFGGVGLTSPCSPVVNCGQMLCLCFTDQSERLCSKPNVDCNEEAPWVKAAEVGAECEAFEFKTANKLKGTTGICSPVPGQPEFCEIKIPESRYPEAAKHIKDVQGGFREHLTLRRQDKSAKDARRAASRKKFKDENGGMGAPTGYDIDEFPPAMTEEGGAKASVRAILKSDNRGAGACMGKQVGATDTGLTDGTPLQFLVVP